MINKYKLLDIMVKEAEKRGSVSALAKHLGVSLSYMSDVLRGTREPGEKILSALGYKRVVLYAKEGEK